MAIYVEGLFTAEKDATDILLAEQEQDYNTRMRQAEVIENQLRANLREKNDEAIAQVRELGDNLELTLCGQNAPIKFSDFKRELIELAQSNKQKIDHDKTLAFTKERSKIEIDKIVKVIVNAQYKLMKNSFIHLKVYGNYTSFDPPCSRIPELLDNINKLKEQMNKLVDGDPDYNMGTGGILYLTDNIRNAGKDDDDLDREQKQRLEQELEQPPVQNVAVLATATEEDDAAPPPPAATPPPSLEGDDCLDTQASNVFSATPPPPADN